MENAVFVTRTMYLKINCEINIDCSMFRIGNFQGPNFFWYKRHQRDLTNKSYYLIFTMYAQVVTLT